MTAEGRTLTRHYRHFRNALAGWHNSWQRIAMKYFVTGTGTDVGKTYVTKLLIEAANRTGISTVGFKPIACGSRDDAVILRNAGAQGIEIDEINPIIYATPASPYTAAILENRPFEIADALNAWNAIVNRFEGIFVEGAGGWEVPITRELRVADLAVEMKLPVIVVVNNRLGALNETILTVDSIRRRGLVCTGLILNHLEEERDMASVTNRSALEDILDVPVLLDILHGEEQINLPHELLQI